MHETAKNARTVAVYMFVRSRGKWSQQAELTATHADAGDEFG